MISSKKILGVLFFLLFGNFAQAITLSADLFSYDENRLNEEFKELDYLESLLIENSELTLAEIVEQNSAYEYLLVSENYFPAKVNGISATTQLHSFWWAFAFSLVGSYTIYGAVAGPITVGVIYFVSKKDKAETKKAIYGCLTGTVLGLGIRYLTTL